jgi:glutathione S-transferase
VSNHEAVTRFALRAVGQRGPRPVSAALCDPTAIPGMEHIAHADGALRHVAHALLVGVDAKAAGPAAFTTAAAKENGCELEGALAAPSLAYARDRVCVPRDLDFPAAREFRAHMNYIIAQCV